jgi:hypothetical protein
MQTLQMLWKCSHVPSIILKPRPAELPTCRVVTQMMHSFLTGCCFSFFFGAALPIRFAFFVDGPAITGPRCFAERDPARPVDVRGALGAARAGLLLSRIEIGLPALPLFVGGVGSSAGRRPPRVRAIMVVVVSRSSCSGESGGRSRSQGRWNYGCAGSCSWIDAWPSWGPWGNFWE